jgi:hypothetical protein
MSLRTSCRVPISSLERLDGGTRPLVISLALLLASVVAVVAAVVAVVAVAVAVVAVVVVVF